jgi:glycosyltransferase involved in cell wall biosynthesis
MICYNQENYIRTALDSVLCERVKPYEIIIGDDASTDGTRRIIEEYREQYPVIIKVFLNESNLGIPANLNNVAPKATGDMVHFLSGDDWFKPGLLERMDNKIQEMNLDPQKSRFVLLPHVVLHSIDGSEILLKNDPRQLEKYSPVGAKLRGIVVNNQVGYSRAMFDMWPLFPDDSEMIGPWADLLQYVMFIQYSDRQIVMDCAGHVYRMGVGITSRTKLEELLQSYHHALVRVQYEYKCGNLKLCKVDSKYLAFHERYAQLSMKYNAESLKNALLSAADLAMADMSEVRFIARDFYRVHRGLASRLIRKMVLKHYRQ